MKGRKHDLNYPFDPAAVSDPACWLPPSLAQSISHRFSGRLAHQRLPREFKLTMPFAQDANGEANLPATDWMADFQRAADLIDQADGLLITAGAGMGVDSGLPDFRGNEGFWKAYPALARARLSFTEIACPDAFRSDVRLAWGFYGHRLALYRRTIPHEGFQILRQIAQRIEHGAFVFTSNVDGQFQKAGFDPQSIHECHGSIHHLQCTSQCLSRIWSADGFQPELDESICRLTNALPTCPECGAVARPNILMFGDYDWIEHRSNQQNHALQRWLFKVKRLLVIELGAGVQIATVRRFSEQHGRQIIRINPTEPQVGATRGIGLRMGALAALEGIAQVLGLETAGALSVTDMGEVEEIQIESPPWTSDTTAHFPG